MCRRKQKPILTVLAKTKSNFMLVLDVSETTSIIKDLCLKHFICLPPVSVWDCKSRYVQLFVRKRMQNSILGSSPTVLEPVSSFSNISC
jgi:hypothetical protein